MDRARRPASPEVASASKEVLAVDSHLQFAARLIGDHSWTSEQTARFSRAVERVEQRGQGDHLYVAVVGEFSSGKSTWINALLRRDLLPTGVVPATTAAVTVLRHGPRELLEVELRDGERVSYVLATVASKTEPRQTVEPRDNGETAVSSLAEPLSRYVADEEVAREVAKVTIFSPSPILATGMVFLDTPGTNVDNSRHIEVTQGAIDQLCDVAVVLIPARLQLSRSFARYLSKHLADSLHRSIFVVTMIDRIEPAERDSVLRVIRSRIESLLEVSEPTILPLSAVAVLAEVAPDNYELSSRIDPVRRQRLVEEFERAEEVLVAALTRQRGVILLERLAALLDGLYEDLASGLDTKEQCYAQEFRALEDGRIPDLTDFAQRSRADRCARLAARCSQLITTARQEIGHSRREASRSLAAALDRAKTEMPLTLVMKLDAPAAMRKARAHLQESLAGLLEDLRQAASEVVEEFEAEFRTLYQPLATLDADGSAYSAALHACQTPAPVGISGKDPWGLEAWSSCDEDFAQCLVTSSAQVGGVAGGVVGALPGVAVGGCCGGCIAVFVKSLPVFIGLAVGGILGGLTGAAVVGGLGLLGGLVFSTSADTLRPTYRAHLEQVLGECFDAVETAALTLLEARQQQTIRHLKEVVDRYGEHFADQARAKVNADERKAEVLANHRQQLKQDIAQLASQRRNLSASRDGLRALQEI